MMAILNRELVSADFLELIFFRLMNELTDVRADEFQWAALSFYFLNP